MAERPLSIGLVAGEASGDNLGAALIEAIRARRPDTRFVGVPGRKMRGLGCEAWAEADELALLGLAEILRHLPRLVRLRRRLVAQFEAARPDVFVGIDAPEFNLGLERKLKARGITTAHYVSPQVWAWRQGRVRTMGESCDVVLCLLPFEPEFYAKHGVPAMFVGHPLADQFPLEVDRGAARRALGLSDDGRVVALLPGSRRGEVGKLGLDFAATAAWLAARRPELRFVVPLVSPAVRAIFEAQWARAAGSLPVVMVDGCSREVLAAADAVLVASGTATLEALLSRRPMVVAYRLAPATAAILRGLGLVKVEHFAQPNLLLGRRAVPEFFQEQVRPDRLGPALLEALDDGARRATLEREFREVHERLRRGGAGLAAEVILDLAARRGV